MPRSLVIAPQWIGDAVMTEPLLARLAARGEQIAVAALPWVAPVYRAMPQRSPGRLGIGVVGAAEHAEVFRDIDGDLRSEHSP